MSDEISSIVEYSVDLAKQEAPIPLPVGEYNAVIRGSERKISQRETQYAAVTFHISPDKYPADYVEGNPDGTIIVFRRVSLEDNPQARFTTRRFIEAIGAPLGKKIDVSEWVGMEGKVEVGHSNFEGVDRPEIQRVRAA